MGKDLDAAFNNVPRQYFLPYSARGSANIDTPLPIGYGQTNSQPSLVYDMLDWLGAGAGDKVLDVGSGSGWTTALIANIVGHNTTVYAVEIVPELVDFAKKNCANLGINNVKFYLAKKHYGLVKYSPFDKILVSAAASSVPKELVDQLANNGTMVVPVNNDIYIINKDNKGNLDYTIKHGYVFVPLLEPQ